MKFSTQSWIFAALVLLAGGGWLLSGTNTPEKTTIRIGINPWMGYEYLYLAEKQGFFAEEGLDVRLLQFSSLEDVRAAFERGHVDGITSTVVEVIQANAARGQRKAQAVLVADFSNGADVILARHSITSVAHLKGKAVAAEKASLGIFMLARALEKSGMSLNDVKALAYDQPAMEKAFNDGIIDAMVTYPPFSVGIMEHSKVSKIFDSSSIPGEILDTLSLDRTTLQKNPKLAPALRRVWAKSLAYAEAHPAESNLLMAQRENISKEAFEEGLKGIHIVAADEQVELMKPGGKLEHAIAFMSKVLHDSGELEKTVEHPGDYIYRGE